MVSIEAGKVLTVGGKIASHEDCCCGRSCSECIDGKAANQYQVDISGISTGSCNDCDYYNGSYVLDYVSDCNYLYARSPVCTNLGSFTFEINLRFISGELRVALSLVNNSTGVRTQLVGFTNVYGSGNVPCMTLSATSVTRTAEFSICAVTAAACTITTL